MIRFLPAWCGLALALSGCAPGGGRADFHASAGPATSRQAVVGGLARYRGFVLRTEPDSIASLFDSTAEVSHASQPPIVGRSAIRAFLASFSGFRVLEYDLDADWTRAQGDSAVQHGKYRQKVIVPAGDTVSVRGVFDALWSRQADGGWLLHRMHTAPPAGR